MSAPITVIGNLTADPELRFTPSGKAVIKFTVATSKSVKNADGTWTDTDTTYWPVSAWDKLAENAAESLRKGDGVIVQGDAASRSWEKDDQKFSRMEVTARNIAVSLKRAIARPTKADRTSEPKIANDPWTTGGEGVPF